MASALKERLAAVEARIADACSRAGRPRSAVRLVGVTKGKGAAVIREAVAEGLTVFGENYVQEWQSKRAELSDLADVEWHFVGRIQRNKAAAVAGATLVHSVADARVAAALDAAGAKRGRPVAVLVQVNLDAEESKDGVAPDELAPFLETIRRHEWLEVRGLMAIPAPAAPEDMRDRFRALSALRYRQRNAEELSELSMGMSADFDVAIEEGATLVRVGTAIFGPRERTT